MSRPVVAVICGVLMTAAVPLMAQSSVDELTITLDAESTEANGRNGAIAFTGIRVSQGNLSISADHANASGLDFRSSQWTFEGNVRFASGGSTVSAGRAILAFEDQQLVSADLSGPPVRFEQNLNGTVALVSREARLEFARRTLSRARFNGAPVTYEQTGDAIATTAEARRIVIDQAAGTIDLSRDALIREGTREIRGDNITYNYLERSVVAAGDSDERVTITIAPPASSDPAPTDETQEDAP